MRVEYAAAASRDFDAIRSHIARDRPIAAERMYQRLLAACERLVDFPQRGRTSHRSGLREVTTVQPYVILYSLEGSIVRIRRIVHGARLR